MTYRNFGGDLPVPRIRIFRTREQIDRALKGGAPCWRIVGNIGYASPEDLWNQNTPLGIENGWNYDEKSGRTILVEVDAV